MTNKKGPSTGSWGIPSKTFRHPHVHLLLRCIESLLSKMVGSSLRDLMLLLTFFIVFHVKLSRRLWPGAKSVYEISNPNLSSITLVQCSRRTSIFVIQFLLGTKPRCPSLNRSVIYIMVNNCIKYYRLHDL